MKTTAITLLEFFHQLEHQISVVLIKLIGPIFKPGYFRAEFKYKWLLEKISM